jgi:hypothetical protein
VPADEWIIVEGYESIAPFYAGPVGDPEIGAWVEGPEEALGYPTEESAVAAIAADPVRFDRCVSRRRRDCMH